MMAALLEVKELKKYFPTGGGLLHAVDDINFRLEEGKTLGVVGESGCGKTTLGRVILHLLDLTDGQIFFEGEDISYPTKKELIKIREKMQIIFQDPYSSLNPRMSVSETIMEPLILQGLMKKNEMLQETRRLMDTVGLAMRFENSYPHELDGGRRQRIGIARALAVGPDFIVADEPVSALDVSIQAQILNLLKEIQRETGVAYVFITHDLSVVNHFSDEIAVMYLGRIVEKAPAEALFARPLHPYTRALLSAIPVPRIRNRPERILLRGEIKSPIDPPSECRFKSRCPEACPECDDGEPELFELEPNHDVACHRRSADATLRA